MKTLLLDARHAEPFPADADHEDSCSNKYLRRRCHGRWGVLWLGIVVFFSVQARGASPPNVLLILADDLGYGDVQCYNPERGKIPTPHLDRLAVEGMRFTDAHTSSGVCSPTRYTLLTGRYHWRSRLQSGIITYLEEPLIAADRWTLASMLRARGYRTAAIGKWHLGWDWNVSAEQRPLIAPPRNMKAPPVTGSHRQAWSTIYAQAMGGGPTSRGFETYFGTDVPNWPPYAFIRDDHTIGIPSEFLPARLLVSRLAGIPGPALPGWRLEDVLPRLVKEAQAFLEQASKETAPFFLYLPLTSPHTPIAVNPEWKGKSGLNAYADFVMETDAAVGRVLATLEGCGAAENTLVIFTSDNGCATVANIPELQRLGHYPSGPLRGHKTDVWEGGHRVPMIVRWPGQVQSGSVCHQLVHQADWMATLAELIGTRLPDNAGEDSFSLTSLLAGEERPVREHAVSCGGNGLPSLRWGGWKLVANPKPTSGIDASLFFLDEDLGEEHDLAALQPEQQTKMKALFEALIEQGRSTPGPRQSNDVPVVRYFQSSP
jgi:arylsulfatase A-like enzyme